MAAAVGSSARNTWCSQDVGTQAAKAPAISRPQQDVDVDAGPVHDEVVAGGGEARRRSSRRSSVAALVDAHVHRGVALHRPASPLSACSRAASRIRRAQEQPEQHGQDQDHQRAADELGEGELPAHQQRQDDPHLDDEVGGGDLEGHRRREVRALAEQRPGQRHRRVGARAGRRAQAGRHRQRLGRSSPIQRLDRLLAHDGLDRAGQEEPQDQRPEDLPAHRAGHG